MRKLFLNLYGLLFITVALFLISANYLPNKLLHSTVMNEMQRVTHGIYYLINEEIKDLPQSEWEEKIQSLQPHFGYPIELKTIDELELKEKELGYVKEGLAFVGKHDGAEYWYQRIDDSRYAIVVGMEPTLSERGERLSQGPYYLAFKRFINKPQAQWPDEIETLEELFNFPMTLIKLDEVELADEKLEKLHAGRIIGLDIFNANETYYKRIGDSDLVFKAGPVGEPAIFKALQIFILICFALVVAFAVFFWVRPLWRDVSQINVTTAAFGRGEFNKRATVSKRSALAEMADTFNSMAERIQGLISSHKELTNAVSHELRTPISRLRFGVEILEESKDEATRQRHIKGMKSDIDELDALVAELLTYARFDRDTPELKLSGEKLEPWLTNLIARNQIGAVDINISTHIQNLEDNECGKMEPKLMARALTNLLQNAIRYANKQIDVHLRKENEHCLLIVDDDGPGIPLQQRDAIFDPFTRLDASRDRESGGFGLGLAIVKRIVDWHQGEVSIDESPQGGARFIIRWPG